MRADVFLDTRVLVYAYSQGDYRTKAAKQLLFEVGVVGVQVLNEFASVARADLVFSWAEVQEAIQSIAILCPNPRPMGFEIRLRGLGVCERYGFSIWDGLIVAAALEARCSMLLIEDVQHGQVVEGVRIENPFRSLSRPRLRVSSSTFL